MYLVLLCGFGATHGLAPKGRFHIAHEMMKSSGDCMLCLMMREIETTQIKFNML
jgi:hypothetical protein